MFDPMQRIVREEWSVLIDTSPHQAGPADRVGPMV
jgi:hypothetical protein